MQTEGFESDNMKIENIPIPMLFHQVSHMHKHYFMQLLRQMNVKPGQAGILFTLKKYGEVSQRELADRIGVRPPSVTVALQKMEKNGYISRRPDEHDQRITRIEITEKGLDCVENMNQIIEQTKETLFQNISAEEILILRRLMLQMRMNILSVKDLDLSAIEKPSIVSCGHDEF